MKPGASQSPGGGSSQGATDAIVESKLTVMARPVSASRPEQVWSAMFYTQVCHTVSAISSLIRERKNVWKGIGNLWRDRRGHATTGESIKRLRSRGGKSRGRWSSGCAVLMGVSSSGESVRTDRSPGVGRWLAPDFEQPTSPSSSAYLPA